VGDAARLADVAPALQQLPHQRDDRQHHLADQAKVQVRNRIALAPFYTETDRFIKTGSGQTQGNHSKGDALTYFTGTSA
jgi:hypothetical protein